MYGITDHIDNKFSQVISSLEKLNTQTTEEEFLQLNAQIHCCFYPEYKYKNLHSSPGMFYASHKISTTEDILVACPDYFHSDTLSSIKEKYISKFITKEEFDEYQFGVKYYCYTTIYNNNMFVSVSNIDKHTASLTNFIRIIHYLRTKNAY